MSALEDFAAAILPPEAGGPEPRRVAAATRRLVRRTPRSARAGIGAGFAAIELAALVRIRSALGSAAPERRAQLLRDLAAGGPGAGATIDALKSIVLMAWGADAYAPEIAETGSRHQLSRPTPELELTPASEWPARSMADALVVGSGAGGAFAARALARAGHEVIVIEEGERWTAERFRVTHPLDRVTALYRDAGASFALGYPAIPLPIGRAVGGTTVINSGTCYRPPEPVVRAWLERHGLRLADPDELAGRLDDVERTIGVGPVPADVIGRNGELALAGAAELGWRAGPLRRNAPGCRGACQCSIGCPNNAKAGVHLNALPEACAAGARIVSALRVEQVLVDRGRATGVLARRADGSAVEIRAPKVIVACGATETPPLLRRSGLGRHPRLGYGLSIHPALSVTGEFGEPVFGWRGVLQSAGIEELHEREGILLEATSTPPGMGSMMLPGFGAALIERLSGAAHLATVGAMIADRPGGRVAGSRRPLVLYRLARAEQQRLVRALEGGARVLLAAGAERVELGGGAPPVRGPRELSAALDQVDIRRLHLAAFHPSGTAAAGADPGRHPVGPGGELRGARGIWVADASILPSCPGVNPQISIMGMAAGVGERAAR